MTRGGALALVIALLAGGCSSAPTADDLADSVFRVRGEGCRAANIGTAFAVAPELVLTNAHVVAGVTRQLVVADADGRTTTAVLIGFDPVNDLALLEVPGLDAKPLALGPAVRGDGVLADARIEGELTLIDVEVLRLVDIESGDIYDDGTYLRKGFEAAGDIGPGTSGAPVIVEGSVVGAVFAEVREGGIVFGTQTSEIEAFLDLPRSVIPLPAGACRR